MKHPLSFLDFHKLTEESLRREYAIIKTKTVTFEDFAQEILSPIFGLDDPSIEDPFDIALQFVSEEDKQKGKEHVAKTPYAAIIVASTFLNRSRQAFLENKHSLAWSYMADARYWNGVVCAARGLEAAYQHTIKETKRGVATKGAQARAQKYEGLAQFSHDLVREKKPKLGGWKSRNQAVQAIKTLVLAHAKQLKIKVSENQADKTIDSWLTKMPDAEQLFPKKEQSK